jgi:hypothetical protein
VRIAGRRSHIGIIGSIKWAEASLAGDSALEMLRGFLGGRFFDRVSATAKPESTRGGNSGEDGFQALMVMIVGADGKREVAPASPADAGRTRPNASWKLALHFSLLVMRHSLR